MLRHSANIYKKINIFFDSLLTAGCFASALATRMMFESGFFNIFLSHTSYWIVSIAALVLWPTILNVNGLYPTDRLRTLRHASVIILRSSLQGILILLVPIFLLKLQVVSRLVIVQFSFTITLVLIIKEALVIQYLHYTRRSGMGLKNVLVVGSLGISEEIAKKIEENKFLGLKLLGFLLPSKELLKVSPENKNILGTLNDIEKTIHAYPVDHVIITLEAKDFKDVENIIYHCEQEGVEVWIYANIFNIKMAKLDSDELFGVPIFVFRLGPSICWSIIIKSIADRIVALIIGLAALPILLLSIFIIRLTSKGPAIFKQKRCGLKGRTFTLYKFRTMHDQTDHMRSELQKANLIKGPAFKLRNDPRITPVGRFLRITSIDELPQLWNVLKGDMSLIGPRPPLPEEVNLYKGWHRRRLSMKPGISGLWQVSGRNEVTDFDELARLDLKYIDNWSLWLDTIIFFKTIFVIFSMKGAR